MSQTKVHAADDFALFVEAFERSFHAPVEKHPAVDFDCLLLVEIFRFADRRRWLGEVATFHFVADFVADAHLGGLWEFPGGKRR